MLLNTFLSFQLPPFPCCSLSLPTSLFYWFDCYLFLSLFSFFFLRHFPLFSFLSQPAQDQAAGGAQSATDKARNLVSQGLDTAQSYLGEGQKKGSEAAAQAQQVGNDVSKAAEQKAAEAKGAVQGATK